MITWEDDWTKADKAEAKIAIIEASDALAELSGMLPQEAFHRLFGDITLEACRTLPGRYHGYVMPGDAHRIKLRIGKVTDRLVIHELGHLINDSLPVQDSPAHLLATQGIKTASGKWVTGFQGYAKRGYPWQQHPPNWKDGKLPTERWSDMFLAWATDNLQDNEAGQAIRAFVEGYLRERG